MVSSRDLPGEQWYAAATGHEPPLATGRNVEAQNEICR
jgi:hypothetical protein